MYNCQIIFFQVLFPFQSILEVCSFSFSTELFPSSSALLKGFSETRLSGEDAAESDSATSEAEQKGDDPVEDDDEVQQSERISRTKRRTRRIRPRPVGGVQSQDDGAPQHEAELDDESDGPPEVVEDEFEEGRLDGAKSDQDDVEKTEEAGKASEAAGYDEEERNLENKIYFC